MTTKPPVGALVADTGNGDKIGYVQGHEGPCVQLRPPGGGREWDASPTKHGPLRLRSRERPSP
jgi:hypothetical protein